jgi:GRIP and coiled-coil domain-containing protein 1
MVLRGHVRVSMDQRYFLTVYLWFPFSRLERSKSREGANLEYLKNVTLSYITTSENESKKKMLNAIAAVLQFNDTEMSMVNNHLGKKK